MRKKSSLSVMTAVTFLLLSPLSARAVVIIDHACCDYSNSCPGLWYDSHQLEDEYGGCNNMGDPNTAGHCLLGNKIASCNDDSCYTWVQRLSCVNGNNGNTCTGTGKIFCAGATNHNQAFALVCLGGSHGPAQMILGISSAWCVDDGGYGSTHQCGCSSSGIYGANCS